MKKTMYCVLTVVALLLASAVFAGDNKPADPPTEQVKPAQPTAPATVPAPDLKTKVRERVAGEQAPQAPGVRQGPREMMAANIARLQEQHKAAVDELQKIKLLAVEEKATKTAEALTALIAKHDAQFEQQMQAMQRQMNAMQGAQVQPPAKQLKEADKVAPVEPKKEAEKAPAAEPKKDTEKKTQ